MNPDWQRPQTAAEVCRGVKNAEDFGRNIRDWQHELRKLHSRSAFLERVREAPPLLKTSLRDKGACDAYLAAYVEWLSDRLGVAAPNWVYDQKRTATKAWYDFPPLWTQSFVHAPGAFRRRGVFTVPENVIQLRRGRPATSAKHKRLTNAQRQKRYRARIQDKLARLAELEKQYPS